MKIIIDIPEDDYNFIKEIDSTNSAITERLYNAVANGTPLPKGHGRLGDLDALDWAIWTHLKKK